MRSLEIVERNHGPLHPTFGAACIAIASVRNIIGDFESTRDWLSKALRSMEKVEPTPVRAVAFIQTQVSSLLCACNPNSSYIQLSQVLSKQNHGEEAIQVLSLRQLIPSCKKHVFNISFSALFHMEKAREALLNNAEEGQVDSIVPIHKGMPVYQDVMRALEQTARVRVD